MVSNSQPLRIRTKLVFRKELWVSTLMNCPPQCCVLSFTFCWVHALWRGHIQDIFFLLVGQLSHSGSTSWLSWGGLLDQTERHINSKWFNTEKTNDVWCSSETWDSTLGAVDTGVPHTSKLGIVCTLSIFFLASSCGRFQGWLVYHDYLHI